MISPFRYMYLRPGNLWKYFGVLRMESSLNKGHATEEYVDKHEKVYGVLAEADNNTSERMKHRWDQDQHSLTHTMVVRGKNTLKKGDMLTYEERAFLVLVTDDVGALGGTSLIYLEERNDVR